MPSSQELRDLGYRDPSEAVPLRGTQAAWIDRDAAAELVVSMLGVKASAWNEADIRGKTEVLLAQTGLIADSAVRIELAEDVTARAVQRCARLLTGEDAPEHVRSLTSPRVLWIEGEIIGRLSRRGRRAAPRIRVGARGLDRIDPTQAAVVGALAGDGELIVVEGAAGSGKTTALRATQTLLARSGHRLMVVTPTLKAAESQPTRPEQAVTPPHGWSTSTAGAGTTTAGGLDKQRRRTPRPTCGRATSCSSTRPGCSIRTPLERS